MENQQQTAGGVRQEHAIGTGPDYGGESAWVGGVGEVSENLSLSTDYLPARACAF